VTRVGGVPALKAAMDLLDLAGGAPRPPLLPADEPMRERLNKALSELGLLDRMQAIRLGNQSPGEE